jgi:hypothetical protein
VELRLGVGFAMAAVGRMRATLGSAGLG